MWTYKKVEGIGEEDFWNICRSDGFGVNFHLTNEPDAQSLCKLLNKYEEMIDAVSNALDDLKRR